LNSRFDKLGFKFVKDTLLELGIRLIQLTPPDSTALTLSLFPKSLITIREPWSLSIIVFRAENAERTSNQMNRSPYHFSSSNQFSNEAVHNVSRSR
jgi:hypothetical protein